MIAQVLLASAMAEDEPSSSVVDNETMVLEQIKFASGVVTFILIAIGILGNVLSLVVLTRPNMKVRIIHPGGPPSCNPTVQVLVAIKVLGLRVQVAFRRSLCLD